MYRIIIIKQKRFNLYMFLPRMVLVKNKTRLYPLEFLKQEFQNLVLSLLVSGTK